MPDTLSVVLRSLSFMALFQTAGMTIFMAMFGRLLARSAAPMRRIARASAVAAVASAFGQYLLEAARMADAMSGILDPSLQHMVFHSASGKVLAVRVAGLSLIALSITGCGRTRGIISLAGALLVTTSFLLTGHTAANPLRGALAPLLMVHVTVVAFWYGALPALYVASCRERPLLTARLTAAFSRVAVWLVPAIPAAGLSLALILVRHLAELRGGYGLSLFGKVAGFASLMGLAAMNKWRWGPAIASGGPQALRAFRRSLGIEYVLISAVLGITAIMTTFYSPEP